MAEFQIPHSNYLIDEDTLDVRHHARETPLTITAGGRVALTINRKTMCRFPCDLLAYARDGVPIPNYASGPRPGSVGKRRQVSEAETYPITTISYRDYLARLIAQQGA